MAIGENRVLQAETPSSAEWWAQNYPRIYFNPFLSLHSVLYALVNYSIGLQDHVGLRRQNPSVNVQISEVASKSFIDFSSPRKSVAI